ncbi:zinc finger family protein [Nannochloropsis oceanica]
MITLRVDHLPALMEELTSKGQHCFGSVLADEAGKWVIQLYPHGDAHAKPGFCSIFIKNMVLARGIAAVKIEGNIRIVADCSASSISSSYSLPPSTSSSSPSSLLKVTKAFAKSTCYINPNADGLASSSSWGFHDFCLLSELPSSFTIEAEITVKEVARDDALALHVPSLEDMRLHYPRGQSTLGFIYADGEGGKYSLCLYPNGDNLSREGQLGVFVKVLALPGGVNAVKIEGSLRILHAGQVVASRSFPVSTFLNASSTGAATSSTWGFHDFCDVGEVQDSFIIEADITIKDRAKEPSLQEIPTDYSLERLLDCLKIAHGREVEAALNSRRMLNESQLRTLTLDQLLEMQENITNIIKEKRTQENECSVCQDRLKSMACVPCGHRFCSECSSKISASCPECRQHVTQKIRLF